MTKESKKTKQKKFVELTEVWVRKLLRQISLVGNLSDKSKFENWEAKEEAFKLS